MMSRKVFVIMMVLTLLFVNATYAFANTGDENKEVISIEEYEAQYEVG